MSDWLLGTLCLIAAAGVLLLLSKASGAYWNGGQRNRVIERDPRVRLRRESFEFADPHAPVGTAVDYEVDHVGGPTRGSFVTGGATTLVSLGFAPKAVRVFVPHVPMPALVREVVSRRAQRPPVRYVTEANGAEGGDDLWSGAHGGGTQQAGGEEWSGGGDDYGMSDSYGDGGAEYGGSGGVNDGGESGDYGGGGGGDSSGGGGGDCGSSGGSSTES